MVSKKEKNLIFQVKKSIDQFADGFTWAWKSSINVLKAICDWKKKNFKQKISLILVMKNLDPNLDPDPYWPQMLDPDPYWDQYGSETLTFTLQYLTIDKKNFTAYRYYLNKTF